MMHNGIHTEYFTCACEHPEHTLRFLIDKEDNTFECEIRLRTKHLTFFDRLSIALRYLFKRKEDSSYPFDNWMMKPKSIDRMIALLEIVKEEDKKEREALWKKVPSSSQE